MTRGWTTYVIVAGLAVLLGVLAVLQYRWLSQISASEGEKAHSRVREDGQRFAGDYNREIQNAYFNFQTEAGSWNSHNWTQFNERYDFWQQRTNYPGRSE